MNAEALISLEWNSMFKGNERLPKDPLPAPCWVKGKEDGQSSSRRGLALCPLGTEKNQPPLCPHPLFSETAWFQVPAGGCGLAWKGAGGLLHCREGLGVGGVTLEFMPQSDLKGTPSVFCLPSLGHIAL